MDYNESLSIYYDNIKKLDEINNNYAISLGEDNYLTKLSKTFYKSLNEFIKFIDIMEDKEEYLASLLEFSYDCIELYDSMSLDVINEKHTFKRKRLLKKSYEKNKESINKILDRMDLISNMIDSAIKKI